MPEESSTDDSEDGGDEGGELQSPVSRGLQFFTGPKRRPPPPSPAAPPCGDGVCEEGETFESCEADCGFGSGASSDFLPREWRESCPSDRDRRPRDPSCSLLRRCRRTH